MARIYSKNQTIYKLESSSPIPSHAPCSVVPLWIGSFWNFQQILAKFIIWVGIQRPRSIFLAVSIYNLACGSRYEQLRSRVKFWVDIINKDFGTSYPLFTFEWRVYSSIKTLSIEICSRLRQLKRLLAENHNKDGTICQGSTKWNGFLFEIPRSTWVIPVKLSIFGVYWNGHFTDSLTEIYRKEKLLYIGCLHILFNLTSFSMTDSGNFALRSVSMTVNIYYHTNGKLQAPVQMIRSREFQLASRWRGLRFGWNILPSFRASVVPTSSSSSPPVNKSRVKLPSIGSTRAEHGRKENVQGADMGGQNEGVITNVRSRRTCVSYYLNC